MLVNPTTNRGKGIQGEIERQYSSNKSYISSINSSFYTDWSLQTKDKQHVFKEEVMGKGS